MKLKLRVYVLLTTVFLSLGSGHLMASRARLSAQRAYQSQGPMIRVLLEKGANAALLEAKGEYAVINKENGKLLSTGTTGKRFVVHSLEGGLKWGEEYPDVFQIAVIPRNPKTMLYVNGMQYKGAVSVYRAREGRILVVNELPIEDYLKSVLSLQLEAPLTKEAGAAIAIAARTEAFAITRERDPKKLWDVVASEVNYFGHAVTMQKDLAIEPAVNETKFMVLESTQEGKPLRLVSIVPQKAQEFADRGFDAKKILQNSYPHSKLSVTSTTR